MHVTFKAMGACVAAAALILVLAATAAASGSFTVTPLVSNNGVPGTTPDDNLVNAWGLAAGPATPWWVADNGTGVSTLYTGAGAKLAPLSRWATPRPAWSSTGRPASTIKGGNSGPRPVPVRQRGRRDQRLERLAREHRRGRDRHVTARGRCSRGSRSPRPTAGPRLYATDFHNRRVDVFDGIVAARPQSVRVLRPDGPAQLCAVRDPGDRLDRSTSPTRRRSPEATTRSHGRVSGSSTRSTQRAAVLAGKVAFRGPLNAPWGLAHGAGQASAGSAATCSSATSATDGSTPTGRSSAASSSARRPATRRRRDAPLDRRPLGARVRHRRRRRPRRDAVLHRRAKRGEQRPLRHDRSRLDRARKP